METRKTNQLSVGGGISVTSRDAYNHYRKNRKRTAKALLTYERYTKSVGAMFTEIKNMMLEADAGVHLEGLGYFCFIMNPKKTRKKLPKCSPHKNDFEYLKKKHRYYPYFFGYQTYSVKWTMSMAFRITFTYEFKQTVKAGRRYRMIYTQLLALQKANRQTKSTKNKDKRNAKTE